MPDTVNLQTHMIIIKPSKADLISIFHISQMSNLVSLDYVYIYERSSKILIGIGVFGWVLPIGGYHQDGQQDFPSGCEILLIFILEQFFSERGSSSFLPGGYNDGF